MQPDHALVLGLFLVVLSVPAMISAYSERRPPRVGAVVGVAGLALLLHGHVHTPGGYAPDDVPEALYGVIGDIIR